VNIQEAKRVAGIHFELTGPSGFKKAEKHCKAVIVQIHRTSGEKDPRLNALSEAWQVFKKRTRAPRCEVCGRRISADAVRCRQHVKRLKRLAIGEGKREWTNTHGNLVIDPAPEANPKKPRGQPRDGSNPTGGDLARLGYYTPEVQNVVKKWAAIINDPERLENYFRSVASTVVCRLHTLARLPAVPTSHWQAVFELGAAIAAVSNNPSAPAAWLLQRQGRKVNGRYRSWAEIRAETGNRFTLAEIKNKAKRMRLMTAGNRTEKQP
jgi:hypothetical protein